MGRILVLDDERDACRLIERVLSLSGHEVHAFTDYREAAEWVQRHKPDLALIDIRLRDSDGLSFLRLMRSRHADAKAIMITGYPSAESANEAMSIGAEDYLIKPIEIDELEDRVKEVLGESL
jgi:DNA-binding NtrC family response regulator